MKKSTLMIICALLLIKVLAQVPQSISHQAVIRDATNNLVTNSQIGIRVTIIHGNPDGNSVYSETHTPVSNANGLITFIIGQGTIAGGAFNHIDWANGPYFIKTEADPAGGTNYTITGISQLFSVPYALHSNKASTLVNGQEAGEILFWDGSEWVAIPPGQHDETLRFCDGIPTWGECPYNLFLLAEPELGGEVNGAGKFKAGEEVPVAAISSEGWQFVSWTDAGGIVSVVPGFNYTMPANDVTLTANFEMTDYTLTLDANPAQGGSVSGGGIYNFGDQSQLNATANLGWEFVSWTDDDGIVSVNPDFTYTMPATDITLTANFEMIDYTLVLVANPSEGGSVNGGGDYNYGDEIQLNASASTGWQFVTWTDGDGILSMDPNFIYTMPAADITLTANFEMIDFTLTLLANPSEGGAVNGGGDYNFSDIIQVNAIANSGWEFVNWTGDTEYVDDPSSPNTSVTMPAAHISLTANFQEDPILPFTCGNDITFIYRGTEVTYGTIERGGLCWLDRNLGASQVPVSMTDAQGFGDLFQWGRLSDGHQDRQSATTTNLSNNDVPGHGQFIILDTIPYDWRSPQNDNLWQGNNGINNPCPSGWRVPTGLELDTERLSWATSNASGAYGSTLKWPVAGNRFNDGIVYAAGSVGLVWSSSYTGTQASSLIIESDYAGVQSSMRRARGMSVRCVREDYLTPELFDLNLNANPAEGGTFEGQGQYEAGEQINITATSNPGWEFVNWTGDTDYADDPASPNTSVTMPAQNISLTANFVEEQPGFNCGDPLIDTRDGQSYATVQIGNQCWMAENLNIGTRINGNINQTNNATIEKYCYNNSDAQCDTYGGLYQWNEMMDYTTTAGAQGICPDGWHLPTDAEWCTLEQEVDPTITCSTTGWRGVDGGGKLKETGTTHWNTPNTGATNSSGFTALPGGGRSTSGSFLNVGNYSVWWSSSQHVSGAWFRYLGYDYAQVYRDINTTPNGFSVRCIKDVDPLTTYNLILEAEPSEAGIVSGAGQYEAGEQVNITAEANPGWEFVNWTDDDGIVSESPNFTYTMPAENDTLTANFVEEQTGFTCGDPLIDSRDSQSYATVQIGNQCWMAENLNIGARINGNSNQTNNAIVEKYCYDNSEANCDVYGGLYQWNEMMQYTTTDGAQGICPDGWHLPTDDEWKILEGTVDSQYPVGDPEWNDLEYRGLDAGGNLKEIGTTHWNSPNTGATNSSNFTALPGGFRDTNGSFQILSSYGLWWTSSQSDISYAWRRFLSYDNAQVFRSFLNKSFGFSVRCLRVATPATTYNLILEAYPSEAGAVSGAGQ